ncbi:MAG: DNA-3-methyladenine glycosylase 2 family protein [Proteobacteria bacterium]|nr:DNA-3-methyladenine glycosylase 2 family protein [Pseudomonadota bacterium]
MEFRLTTKDLKIALDQVARKDQDIREALKAVGYPKQRRSGAPSFEHLLRIIVGQQLSVKAAATIYGRVEAAMGEIIPENFLDKSDQELRGFGLSRQKIEYGRGLSKAVLDGFRLKDLIKKSDQEVLEAITALKGFGRWSAEMFLMFSLGRPDIWPAGDLAVQEAVKKLKGLKERPGQKEMDIIAKPWRPHRASVAVFLWHFYSNPPL